MNERREGTGTAVPIRVVLVDDHTMFRHGLRQALVGHGIDIAGEASNGEAGAQLVAEVQPDGVVMDLHMPVMGGVEAVRAILARRPGVPVLMLTISTEDDDVVEALHAGAAGYISKTAPAEEVVHAVEAVYRGDGTVPAEIAGRLAQRLRRDGDTRETLPPPGTLTARELQILRLVAQGKENHEIAEALVISPSTAKNHVARVLEKLGMDNRVQAAVYAVRAGIV